MALDLTQTEIDNLWEQGFRPYEIYIKNPQAVYYFGEWTEAGEIDGWDIKFVFSTRDALKCYPFFDAVIGVDSMSNPDLEIWG